MEKSDKDEDTEGTSEGTDWNIKGWQEALE